MLKFDITYEQRDQAQKRAVELDVIHSDPPGQFPYVWENWMGCVCRWYDSTSGEGKIGTISFKPRIEKDGRLSPTVECTTEITHLPLVEGRGASRMTITDPEEHHKLADCFFRELLDSVSKGHEVSILPDVTALERRIEELNALNHVATILNSAHDLSRVLELAIERIGAALGAKGGSLLLRDETTEELIFAVTLGPVADQVRGRRLPPGQGIGGWVAQNGEAVLIAEANTDPRFSPEVDQISGFATRSMLCAPLKTSRGIIGVIQILNHVAGRPFTQADLQLLETVALHAAVVIEKAKVVDRERRYMALLALSNVAREFEGPLKSLECDLEVFKTASHQNPTLVPTIQKPMERVESLRMLAGRLSGILPKNSSKTTASDR